MAKLPDALDIKTREYRASSPNIRVPAIDYSPIAKGMEQVNQGVHALVKSQEEQDGYETQRRLLDFKLETEMAHEEYRRTMPSGGDGYVDGWQKEFQKRAQKFVGKEDANVPDHLRGKVGNALKSFEVQLGERAQREALAERDRHEVEKLTGTLGRTISAVSSDPNRIEEMHGEGANLIDQSRLTPAAKASHKKAYRKTLEEAAAGTVADSVRDADSLERARTLLRPDAPDRITAKGVKANIVNQGEHSVISTGSGAKFRVASAHTDRFAGFVSELESLGVEIKGDQSGGYAKRNIRGTNTPSKHSHGEAIDINWSENAEGKPGSLSQRLGDEKIREIAARHGLKWGGDFKGRSRDDMHFEVDRTAKYTPPAPASDGDAQGDQTIDLGPGVSGDEADGPIRALSQAQRRAFWQRAQGNFEKVKAGVAQVITDQVSVAQQGYAPPAPIMDELRRQVSATKDPMLAARLQSLEQNITITQRLQAAPPLAIEEQARILRENAAQNGATKEGLAAIQHVEKLGESVRKATNEDPMGWAAKQRLNVPFADGPPADLEPRHRAQWQMPVAPVELEQIDFRSPEVDRLLATRAEQAKAVGRYYGQPPQLFTKNEREFLKDTLRKGGDGMLFVLGKIGASAAKAGIEPSAVMKEFTKDAPEVAVIGEMVANNADPTIQKTAAAALAWRAAQGEKFVSTIDKLQAQPDISEYADVLATTPTRVDAVKQTANLLYEYEARRNGVTQFDGTLYKSVLRRIMGETTDSQGNAYGGVGKQGSGWTDGKWSTKVFVPAEIRQDSFDDMVGAIRARDLPDPPVDANGKELSMTDIRRATWVSVGPGRYVLEQSKDADGTRVVAHNRSGEPYVLDIRGVLPAIQKRKPEIFRGYDGLQRGRMEPDPEYGFGGVAPTAKDEPAPASPEMMSP
jgi:hypothetical protein